MSSTERRTGRLVGQFVKPAGLLNLGARLLLGSLFCWAGVSKILEPRRFVAAVDWLEDLLPQQGAMLQFLPVVLPRLELLLGLCLLIGLYQRQCLLVAVSLLLTFEATILLVLIRGRRALTCGCFGDNLLDQGGPTWWVIRNLLLLVLALAAWRWGRPGLSFDSWRVRDSS